MRTKHQIQIITDKPVAFDSPDHIQPHGTARDNSTSNSFKRKLLQWIPRDQLKLLDLGCSGGKFVKSILDEEGLAVGIEGSDYSKKHRRAEWVTIPEFLFTADLTAPFQLFETDSAGQQQLLRFNVVTAWEVIEHIRTDQLGAVFENISRHLTTNGVIIMSISPNEEVINGVKLHQTVADKIWWLATLAKFGYRHHEIATQYFGLDWVRNEFNAPGSFHVVLTRQAENLPNIEQLEYLVKKARPLNLIKQTWLRRIKPMVSAAAPPWLKTSYRRLKDRN